jgi:hypothetical protein
VKRKTTVNTAKLGDNPLILWARRRFEETELDRQVAEIAVETGGELPTQHSTVTAAGDPRKLRGIPAIGYGVGGAMANTQPELAYLRKEGQP